ncbi:MAG: hypothetical protein KAH35_01835, partial [Candidatus Atribacteria bacterium]|nr:hypothetical protein [Candidatus Atribacteria bacterium]
VISFQFTVNKKYKRKEMQDKKTRCRMQEEIKYKEDTTWNYWNFCPITTLNNWNVKCIKFNHFSFLYTWG